MKNNLLLILLLGFFYQPIKAQESLYPITNYLEKYPFIKIEHNKIDFYENRKAFNDIFKKLDDLVFEGKNDLHIIQFGGSHIQADYWSGQFRYNLQRSHPGIKSGRGLVFPYKMAKTNHPYNYYTNYTGNWKYCKNLTKKNSCLLGIMDLNVNTTDANSEISVFLRESYQKYIHHSVQIFHETDSNYYEISLRDTSNIKSRYVNYDEGYTYIEFKNPIDTLHLKLHKTNNSQKEFMLFGINLINEKPGVVFNAVGNNGASVPSYLNADLLPQHLKSIKPDLIIFSMGINDAHGDDFSGTKYEADYDSLMNRILKVLPDVKFILTTNNDSYYRKKHPEKNALEVRETMIRLAKKRNNVAVWDMFEIMGGLGSITEWEKNGLSKTDKIHLTKEGYIIMGDLFYFAFMDAYKKYLRD